MKKILSISFAFLILLSGMHLTLATHICGGEVAAVKWSFTGKQTSCGMENVKNTKTPYSISSDCCKNEIAVYAVDSNYKPSTCQQCELSKNIVQEFAVPASLLIQSITPSNLLLADSSPPDNLFTSEVCLADICIFRI